MSRPMSIGWKYPVPNDFHDGVQRFARVRWVVIADPENNEFCVRTGNER